MVDYNTIINNSYYMEAYDEFCDKDVDNLIDEVVEEYDNHCPLCDKTISTDSDKVIKSKRVINLDGICEVDKSDFILVCNDCSHIDTVSSSFDSNSGPEIYLEDDTEDNEEKSQEKNEDDIMLNFGFDIEEDDEEDDEEDNTDGIELESIEDYEEETEEKSQKESEDDEEAVVYNFNYGSDLIEDDEEDDEDIYITEQDENELEESDDIDEEDIELETIEEDDESFFDESDFLELDEEIEEGEERDEDEKLEMTESDFVVEDEPDEYNSMREKFLREKYFGKLLRNKEDFEDGKNEDDEGILNTLKKGYISLEDFIYGVIILLVLFIGSSVLIHQYITSDMVSAILFNILSITLFITSLVLVSYHVNNEYEPEYKNTTVLIGLFTLATFALFIITYTIITTGLGQNELESMSVFVYAIFILLYITSGVYLIKSDITELTQYNIDRITQFEHDENDNRNIKQTLEDVTLNLNFDDLYVYYYKYYVFKFFIYFNLLAVVYIIVILIIANTINVLNSFIMLLSYIVLVLPLIILVSYLVYRRFWFKKFRQIVN